MPRIQMDALFTIAGRVLTILALTLLSACIKSNVINVDCSGDEKPGINCSTGAIQIPQGTLVSSITNIVTIPVAGQTIPNGATCLYNANPLYNSTKCAGGVPGKPCGFTPGKVCRDTYHTTTSKCECRCN
jgi:hypothetical protein